jgi:hypothetical protein
MKWLLVLLAAIGVPELLAVLAFVFFACDWFGKARLSDPKLR